MEPEATVRVSGTVSGRRLFCILLPLLLATGLWQAGEGLWIYGKARLAQQLLRRAWTDAVQGTQQPKPWPWADTWPVARLRHPRLGIDLIVLGDASGHALAFGPAYVAGTALPGTQGTMMITGHRDTHFAFLQRIEPGDLITIDTPDGRTISYLVGETAVLDSRVGAIASDARPRLALITCYPFDAVTPGGPWRFVVMAEQSTWRTSPSTNN
ncbi:MAG TPA: class GN sortase [Nitrospiraceae bacterium]|nr:class GN sortase [Nitrospiraceae bacterium]